MTTHLTGRADLHMHTTASDGRPTVIALLDYVAQQRKELNVIAITDHDSLDASLWAYEQQHRYSFDIVPGVEVTSRDGHVLALWVTDPIPLHMSLAETAQAIHEAGGLAVLAHPIHPYMWEHFKQGLRYVMHPDVLLESGIDAIEAHNAGMGGTGFNWIAALLARKQGLAVTGGSDAHTLGAIGTGTTYFTGQRAADLRKAIINRKTVARGRPWSITDYVGYFKHARQRKAMISSVTTNSSPLIGS